MHHPLNEVSGRTYDTEAFQNRTVFKLTQCDDKKLRKKWSVYKQLNKVWFEIRPYKKVKKTKEEIWKNKALALERRVRALERERSMALPTPQEIINTPAEVKCESHQ